jgi:hypothetical protein
MQSNAGELRMETPWNRSGQACSDEDEFGEDVTDMLERTKGNPNAIIYGTFHTYPKM